MMNDLFTDIGTISMNKAGEQLCGDHVEVVKYGDNSTVIVLADGLGSGVKANILSILTSKILSTMIANNISIDECIDTIIATLPVCKVRQLSYSTFTVLRITDNMYAELIQYDNPHVIFLRNGKNTDIKEDIRTVQDKTIYSSRIRLSENDTFVLMSDGAIHTGVGGVIDRMWGRECIADYLEKLYDPESGAKTLSTLLADECRRRYGGTPGDDTTVCTVKIRRRKPLNLMIGPPSDPSDVTRMMSLFFSKDGSHIVCGGTTAELAAKHLGKTLRTTLDYEDPDIPPISEIEGVDLVTEGVITMKRVLEYVRDYLYDNDEYYVWSSKKDGASRIALMLLEDSTDINFFVGRAVNPAHQSEDSTISFNVKMRLVDELAGYLQTIGKNIRVSYF